MHKIIEAVTWPISVQYAVGNKIDITTLTLWDNISIKVVLVAEYSNCKKGFNINMIKLKK